MCAVWVLSHENTIDHKRYHGARRDEAVKRSAKEAIQRCQENKIVLVAAVAASPSAAPRREWVTPCSPKRVQVVLQNSLYPTLHLFIFRSLLREPYFVGNSYIVHSEYNKQKGLDYIKMVQSLHWLYQVPLLHISSFFAPGILLWSKFRHCIIRE